MPANGYEARTLELWGDRRAAVRYYRGGNSLRPRPIDVVVDPATGLLRPGRGVSVQSVPDGLDRFGGAFELADIPADLQVVKTGRNPTHYELAPARSMTLAEYEAALQQVRLMPPGGMGGANDDGPT